MRYLIPAVLLLSACASTPEYMRQNEPDYLVEHSRKPMVVAECARERLNSLPYEQTNGVLRDTQPTVSNSSTVSLIGHNQYGTPYIVDFDREAKASVYISRGYQWSDTTEDAVLSALSECATD